MRAMDFVKSYICVVLGGIIGTEPRRKQLNNCRERLKGKVYMRAVTKEEAEARKY